jgi:mono/diheme cytochrome c family protein
MSKHSLPHMTNIGHLSCVAFVAAAMLFCISTVPSVSDTADMRGGAFALQGGEAIYSGVCQGCHMADAKGASGAGIYPALAGNPALASAKYIAGIIIKGRKGMPALGDNFTDQQIADVVNYVRSHFGNHYQGAMTAADVQPLR